MFALPDGRFGEVPAAVAHLHDGVALTPEELRGYLAQRLAAFKAPHRISSPRAGRIE